MEKIRKAIKWYMIDNRLNGVDLAAQMGVSACHLSGVLSGKKPIPKKFMDFFGIKTKVIYVSDESTLKKYLDVLEGDN